MPEAKIDAETAHRGSRWKQKRTILSLAQAQIASTGGTGDALFKGIGQLLETGYSVSRFPCFELRKQVKSLRQAGLQLRPPRNEQLFMAACV